MIEKKGKLHRKDISGSNLHSTSIGRGPKNDCYNLREGCAHWENCDVYLATEMESIRQSIDYRDDHNYNSKGDENTISE